MIKNKKYGKNQQGFTPPHFLLSAVAGKFNPCGQKSLLRNRFANKSGAGFTLIELLVVVSIISLIASIILSASHNALVKARNARWHADAMQLQKIYEFYYNDRGYYPYSYGPMPLSELAPYAKLIPAVFTQGPASYFIFARKQTDPDGVAISDNGSACVRIHDGYIIAIGSETITPETLGDGGVEPQYFEKFGGDYLIRRATPGTYSTVASCPDY